MILGFHFGTSSGIEKVAPIAKSFGLDCFSLFLKNRLKLFRKEAFDLDKEAFKRSLAENDIKVENIVPHAGYLINLASPDDKIFGNSILSLVHEIRILNYLGLKKINVHIGSNPNRNEGISRIIKGLSSVVESCSDLGKVPKIVLENGAGSGNQIGANLEDLIEIFSYLDSNQFGLCIDTAHAFVAGYDFCQLTVVENFISSLKEKIGLKYLQLVHLNNATYPSGSKRDKHANLKHGLISEDFFRLFLSDLDLQDIPMVMETSSSRLEEDIEFALLCSKSLSK